MKSKKGLTKICICILLIVSLIQSPLYPISFNSVNANTTWKQTTNSDFSLGTEDNVIITSTGEIKLGQFENNIIDDYNDNSKINYKENITLNSINGIAELFLNYTTFGGSNYENGKSIQETLDGGLILTGSTSSFGVYYDIWLIKTNKNGEMEWNKTYGGSNIEHGESVNQTSDGGYVILGYTNSYGNGSYDFWLIKVNKTGEMEWNNTFGGPDEDKGFSVQQTNDSGFILCGCTQSYGAGFIDFWIIKTNKTGEEQWNKTFGGISSEFGYSIQETNDNGYIINGYTDSYGNGKMDVWLIKINETGCVIWNNTFGGTELDFGRCIRQTKDEGYIISGYTNSYGSGNYDYWLIKTNKTGIMQWNRTFGGNGDDEAYFVQETSDNGYVIIGKGSSTDIGNLGIWFIKTNETGTMQWNRSYNENGKEYGYATIEINSKGFVIIGSTEMKSNSDIWLINTDLFGKINFTGYFNSTNLLVDENNTEINNFKYQAYIPSGTYGIIQFSQDRKNWFKSTNKQNEWDDLTTGIKIIDLSNLNWKGPNFYYKIEFLSTNKMIPYLKIINISFNQYHSSGSFTSQPFNTGNNINLKNINWTSIEQPETNIRFQIRSAASQSEIISKNFVGPDGSVSSYYETSGESIWSGHGPYQCIQYKAYFITGNKGLTPVLDEVQIIFNYLPKRPILQTPSDESYINNNKPTFSWVFSDIDSASQIGFHWQADNNEDFSSVDYDSGEVTSSTFSYIHSELLNDCSWYWRVKTQDSDDDWGYFSDYKIVKIDTHINAPESISVEPKEWTNQNSFNINWKNPYDLSGIIGAYYKLDAVPSSNIDGEFISGNNISRIENFKIIENGEHIIYIWLKDEANNVNYKNLTSIKFYFDNKIDSPTNIQAKPEKWTNINKYSISWNNPNDLSGIIGVYYKLYTAPNSASDGTFISGKNINSINDLIIIDDGIHDIYIWLKDKAGNIDYLMQGNAKIYLDSTSPQKPIKLSVNPTEWTSINSFEIDWNEPNDLSGVSDGAYYYLNETPPNSQMDGIWNRGKPINIKDISEGENNIYIWLEDNVGNTNFLNYATSVLKLDTTPPLIYHIPITHAIENKEITFNVKAYDNHSGINKVLLYYKNINDIKYENISMIQNGDSYSTTLPSDIIINNGLEYYLKITDNSFPNNEIFFGKNGVTYTEPTSLTDIEIQVEILPKIQNKTPLGDNVPVTSNITIEFNKHINRTSLNDSFSILPRIEGIFYWNMNTLVFDPINNLEYNTSYTIKISKDLKDLKGYHMIEDHQWTFITEKEIKDNSPETNGKNNKSDNQNWLIALSIIIIIIIIFIIIFIIFIKRKNIKKSLVPEQKNLK